ncbi:hypothetical protein QDX27_13190 [Rhizobium sp. BR 318]|uniref:Uncharacterized protein n=1 Tax=Rhizobium paranaense TaxID=1650438 RepID=A0A7W8XXQ2_9HYPH|nr:hypothetical protein [Rhizobium paranaense]MBB5577305.1 hypothetical protein [Rhizobium paranaense]
MATILRYSEKASDDERARIRGEKYNQTIADDLARKRHVLNKNGFGHM